MKMSKEKLREIILSNYEDVQDLKLNSKDVEVFNYIKEPKNAEQITDQFNEIKYGTVKSIIRKLQEKGYITYNKSTKKYEHTNNNYNSYTDMKCDDLKRICFGHIDKIKKLAISSRQHLILGFIDSSSKVEDIQKETNINSRSITQTLIELKNKGYIKYSKDSKSWCRLF